MDGGKLPIQPRPTPKGQLSVKEVASFGPQGEVKVITALRSGKILSELARRSPQEAAEKQPQEEKNLENVAKNLEKIIKEPQHLSFPV